MLKSCSQPKLKYIKSANNNLSKTLFCFWLLHLSLLEILLQQSVEISIVIKLRICGDLYRHQIATTQIATVCTTQWNKIQICYTSCNSKSKTVSFEFLF